MDGERQSGGDPIHHPAHYQGAIECIDAIEAALGPEGFLAYCRGNVLKYAWRAGKKGPGAQDLAKAAWYAERGSRAAARASQVVRPCLPVPY